MERASSEMVGGYWYLRELPAGPELKTAWLGPVAGEFDGTLEVVERAGDPPTVSGIRACDSCTVTDAAGNTYGPGRLRVRIEGEGIVGELRGTFATLEVEGPLGRVSIRGVWSDGPVPAGTGSSRGYLDVGGIYSGELVMRPSPE
jgi:hypothetical protein